MESIEGYNDKTRFSEIRKNDDYDTLLLIPSSSSSSPDNNNVINDKHDEYIDLLNTNDDNEIKQYLNEASEDENNDNNSDNDDDEHNLYESIECNEDDITDDEDDNHILFKQQQLNIKTNNTIKNNEHYLTVKGVLEYIDNATGHFTFKILFKTGGILKSIIIRKVDALSCYSPFLLWHLIVVRNVKSSVWSVYRILNVYQWKHQLNHHDGFSTTSKPLLKVKDIVNYLVSIRRIRLDNEYKPFENKTENKLHGIVYGERNSSVDNDTNDDNIESIDDTIVNGKKRKKSDDILEDSYIKKIENEFNDIVSPMDKQKKRKLPSSSSSTSSTVIDDDNNNESIIKSRTSIYKADILKKLHPLKMEDIILSRTFIDESVDTPLDPQFKSILTRLLNPCFRCDNFYYLLRYFSFTFLLKVIESSSLSSSSVVNSDNGEYDKTDEVKRFEIIKNIVVKYPYMFCFWDKFIEIIGSIDNKKSVNGSNIFDVNPLSVNGKDKWMIQPSNKYSIMADRLLQMKVYEFYEDYDDDNGGGGADNIKWLACYCEPDSTGDSIDPVRSCLHFDSYCPIWGLNTLRNAILDNYDNSKEELREYIRMKRIYKIPMTQWTNVPQLTENWTFYEAKRIYIAFSIYIKYMEKRYYEGVSCMSLVDVSSNIFYYPRYAIHYLITRNIMVWSEGITYLLKRRNASSSSSSSSSTALNEKTKELMKLLHENSFESTKISLSSEQKIDNELTKLLFMKQSNEIDNVFDKVYLFQCSFYDSKYCSNLVNQVNKYKKNNSNNNNKNIVCVSSNMITTNFLNNHIGGGGGDNDLKFNTFQKTCVDFIRMKNTISYHFEYLENIDTIVVDQAHKFSALQLYQLLKIIITCIYTVVQDGHEPSINLLLFGDDNDFPAHGEVQGGDIFYDLRKLKSNSSSSNNNNNNDRLIIIDEEPRIDHPLFKLRQSILNMPTPKTINDPHMILSSIIRDVIPEEYLFINLTLEQIIEEYYEIDRKVTTIMEKVQEEQKKKKKQLSKNNNNGVDVNNNNNNGKKPKPSPVSSNDNNNTTTSKRKKTVKTLSIKDNYMTPVQDQTVMTNIHFFCSAYESYLYSMKIHERKNLTNVSKLKHDFVLRGFSPFNFYVGNWVYIPEENWIGMIEKAYPYNINHFQGDREELIKTKVGKREDIQLQFRKYQVKINGKKYLDSIKSLKGMTHVDFKPVRLYCGIPANTVVILLDNRSTRRDILSAMRYCNSNDFRIYVKTDVSIEAVLNARVQQVETDLGYIISKNKIISEEKKK